MNFPYFIIKYSTKWNIFLILILCIAIEGCKKFLEIPPPQSKLVTESVFNNNTTATAAQTNIYTIMWTKTESWNTSQDLGLYSDELTNYSTSTAQIQKYTNSLQAVTAGSTGYGPWVNAYNYIYDANAVIYGLQSTIGCSPAVKQQLTGEAYFIRAFWHFYLTNYYGDVPLALTTDYTITNNLSRSPRIQVLQQVIKDCQIAQNLLNVNYVDGSDTVATTLRVRPNRAAATALLARAYLYLGDYSQQNATNYAQADSAATAVISNNQYALASLGGVFSTTSKEAIWQLQTPSSQTKNTPDGNNFILIAAPTVTGSNNSTAISPQLLGAFEPGDNRKTSWIGAYTTSGNSPVTYYFPYKYKGNTQNFSSSNITEYNTILRLGEIYLIRAEARAHEGNIAGAQSDLNAIRNRAGLANTTASSSSSLLDAVLHERQVELFTEWGHRWLDLCRTANAPSLMGPPGNVCQSKNGAWANDNHQLLFPILSLDITKNPNLVQNPGY